MMPAFYWHKASPGRYYLWDRPTAKKDKVLVAKSISRGQGRSYLNTVDLPGAVLPTGWGGRPETAIGYTEGEVMRLVAGATFIRENFR